LTEKDNSLNDMIDVMLLIALQRSSSLCDRPTDAFKWTNKKIVPSVHDSSKELYGVRNIAVLVIASLLNICFVGWSWFRQKQDVDYGETIQSIISQGDCDYSGGSVQRSALGGAEDEV
jgi:hypothetical protein